MDLASAEPKSNQSVEIADKTRNQVPDRVGQKRASMAPPSQSAGKGDMKHLKPPQGKKFGINGKEESKNADGDDAEMKDEAEEEQAQKGKEDDVKEEAGNSAIGSKMKIGSGIKGVGFKRKPGGLGGLGGALKKK